MPLPYIADTFTMGGEIGDNGIYTFLLREMGLRPRGGGWWGECIILHVTRRGLPRKVGQWWRVSP